MTPERWQQVAEIYQAALAQPAATRAAFLAQRCGDDSALHREVESLLAQEQASVVVDRRVDGVAASVLGRGARLTPASQVGPYRVVDLLGEGGMGQVYRARDTKLQRDVALKILPDAFVHDADRVARFTREAQVLASLNHPNIGAIYGLEDGGDVHALVLELVEGPTLADRIASGPLPLDEALSLARQIAEALEAAHEHGIVHRDLKPANIKVRDDGTVKVLDFGLAKLTTADPASGTAPLLTYSPTVLSPAVTHAGVILGTAAYMSPEQAKGRPADKRSDIWAFGCVLYEMFTGKRAFEGDDVSDTLAAVLRGEPDWTALPAATPLGIRRLLERCLAKDRRRRVGDIAVAEFLLTAPDATERSQTSVADPGRSKRTTAWLPVATTALVAATLGGAVTWMNIPASPALSVARFSIALPEGQALSGLTRRSLAVSPDGMRIAYLANQSLFIRSLGELAPREIQGFDDPTGAAPLVPMFSPDGGEVAFFVRVTRGGNALGSLYDLRRVPAGGGAATTMAAAISQPCDATWGPDGVVLATGEGVFRVPSIGGTPERLVQAATNEALCGPQMLPGGRTVLFTVADRRILPAVRERIGLASDNAWDAAQIVAQSLADNTRRVLVERASDARYVETGHLLYVVAGTMYAVPFDAARVEVTGKAVPVISGVRRSVPGQPTSATHLALSRTGTLAYIHGPASTAATTFRIERNGPGGTVAPLKLAPAAYAHPRVSPDGRLLAVERNDGDSSDIWIYDLAETSALRRVTFTGNNRFPVWSGDSRRVAFESTRDGPPAVFWQSVSGGAAERLTMPAEGERHRPEAWSRDGKHLLFSVAKGTTSQLVVLTPGVKKTEPLGAHQGSVRGASWSPNGRWIVYALERTGDTDSNNGVFIEPFPPTGSRHQAPRVGRDFHPVWSPDGRRLFYIPEGSGFVSVPVTTTPEVTFGPPTAPPGAPRILLQSWQPRAYDVIADGRFVNLSLALDDDAAAGPSGSGINVVLNWFEELKQRVPVP